ncbi:MAG: carboxypeptidase regulatory-like domain-containing protein [Vicinamibacterales bacterium]
MKKSLMPCWPLVVLALLVTPGSALAQIEQARINGTVIDSQGAVLPGATVTARSAALIGAQTTITEADGRFRFPALPGGIYDITFELAGFQTLKREGIVLRLGQTLTVDGQLQVAALQESVTVTGESPVVDLTTTAVGTTFDKDKLTGIPTATDMWSVLSQSPGVRMQGYDVGGSHKSQAIGYEGFGVRGQSQFTIDGIQSEGNYPNSLSMDEIAVSAAGGDVEINSPGAAIALTIKSGGNTFHSLNNLAYEHESWVSNNLDKETGTRGFTGNPNVLYVETHHDIGGPIKRDRLWFFLAYNYFKIDKIVSGIPKSVATDLGIFHEAPVKLTYKFSQADTIQAHYQWGYKYKPLRGLSASTPLESVLEQDSPYWTGKVQWQRVWSNRWFSDVRYGFHGFDWPMTPNVNAFEQPPRIDVATNLNSGAGWDAFDNKPFRPQALITSTYYLPTKLGNHDLKFGGGYVMDIERTVINGNSGPVRYRDNAGRTDEIEVVDVGKRSDLYTTWSGPDNRNEIITAFLQDRWSPNGNLTFLAGLRYDRQRGLYQPGKRAPILTDIFPTRETPGRSFKPKHNLAPRLGVNYAFGSGKTVVKAFWGRFYHELATVLANNSNPGGENYRIYKFNDLNGNRIYDGVAELGTFVSARGGISTTIDEDFKPPFADEISSALEHQFWGESSVRVAYVRKMTRNEAGVTNVARLGQFTVPRTVSVNLQDFVNGVTGSQSFTVFDIPDSLRGVIQNRYSNFPGADYNYDTIQFGLNKRWPGGFFLQASLDYQWRNELRGGNGASTISVTTSPLNTDPLGVGFFQNVRSEVANRQETRNWQARLAGRYVFAYDIGLGVNYRVQSGYGYTRIIPVSLTNAGTAQFFFDNLNRQYSDIVPILDFRVDKTLVRKGRYKVAAMIDVYNTANSNPVSNFNITNGTQFNRIIATLDPRTVQVGVRFEF